MRIYAELPRDRWHAGVIYATDPDGAVLLEPARARGEADNTNAAAHGNGGEDPARIGGDHPFGVYRVETVVPIDMRTHQADTYGPFFLRLRPVRGQCLEAVQRGHRGGFGIHGGRLMPDGQLRPTYGCLRVDDATVEQLAELVSAELALGHEVLYECTELVTARPMTTNLEEETS